jgi:hypothetical protein
VSSSADYRGTLEAVERIVNRGGDAEDVLRAVLEALHVRRISFARVRVAGSDYLDDALAFGEQGDRIAVPIVFEGSEIGSLELAVDDRGFAERVATLISWYVVRMGSGGGSKTDSNLSTNGQASPAKVRSTFRG